jgi:hypothetical protein
MFDLLLWSFVMALTPPALALVWKMIAGVGHFIQDWASDALAAPAERRLPLGQESLDGSSSHWRVCHGA